MTYISNAALTLVVASVLDLSYISLACFTLIRIYYIIAIFIISDSQLFLLFNSSCSAGSNISEEVAYAWDNIFLLANKVVELFDKVNLYLHT
jgi:hypothetical protein